MSGNFISTGLLTNKGLKKMDIEEYLNKIIKNITIHIIPLSIDKKFTNFQLVTTILKVFTPMVFNPSLTHIAIQLNLENCDDILIIEYGQYLTEDSDLKKVGIFSSSSSKEPRENLNENIYYYINKDGARITIFSSEKIKSINTKMEISELISDLIACQYYNISLRDYWKLKNYGGICLIFKKCECEIKNKISLKELIDNFKEEKWEAKKYNILTHNCQTFGAEIIKILKAVRKNEKDKIRTAEKVLLPGCLIDALRKNEDLSLTNILGRIPIFGLFHDFLCC